MKAIKFALFAAGLLVLPALLSVSGVRGQELPEFAPTGDRADAKFVDTLPPEGRLVNGKPVGKHWKNMLKSLKGWNADPRYWSFKDGVLHGDYDGGKFHNFSYTKKTYADFELNVVIRMAGRNANSGVCIRIHPTDADKFPATRWTWAKAIGAACGKNGGRTWCSSILWNWRTSW